MLTNSIKHSLFLWELEEHWFVYFQLIMKIFTETDTDVSAAQANATGSWENSSERTQFLIKFGSAQAKLQRIFSLFCWDCAALGGQNIGREISKFEKRREKRNVDKDAQRALSYNLVSSFRVISLHFQLHVTEDFFKSHNFFIMEKWPVSHNGRSLYWASSIFITPKNEISFIRHEGVAPT